MVYDSPSDSYQLTDGPLSQSFASSQIDPAQSDAKFTTYTVEGETISDLLSITRAGTGAGQTRYVGAGFWQHTEDTGSAVDARLDAFTYGAQTPTVGIPRTGVASYDVQLRGAHAVIDIVEQLSGSGHFDFDFASGAIYGRINYTEQNLDDGFTDYGGTLTARAMIGSGTGQFTGTISFGGSPEQTGEIHGSFYGPNAEEIGATFSSVDDLDAIAGAIWGGRGTYPLNQSTSLVFPENATYFSPLTTSIKRNADGSGASDDLSITSLYINFDSSRIAYRSPTRIDAYSSAGNAMYDDLLETSSLVAGLMWNKSGADVADAFLYGYDTSATAMPRTGSASYDISIGGIAMPAGSDMQGFAGAGTLRANFAAGTLTTLGGYDTHAFAGAYPVGLTNSFAAISGSGSWSGSAALSGSSFAGTIAFDGALAYSGTLDGGFFGASLQNVGAIVKAGSEDGGKLVATLYGAPGTDISASQIGLIGLTEPTTLQGIESAFDVAPDLSPSTSTSSEDAIAVNYDPVTKSYAIRSTQTDINFPMGRTNVLFLEQDRSSTESDAQFYVYHGAGYDGRIYRIGSGNPELALTYTSFAEFTQTRMEYGQSVTSARYVIFGGQTPEFQMPKSGTANYSGVVYGEGHDGQFANPARLSGDSHLATDFATGATSLTMNLTSTDTVNGVSHALGSFDFATAGSACCSPKSRFALSLVPNAYTSGFANGQFNGPAAAEFAAAFNLRIEAPNGQSAASSIFAGVALGKRN